jgi:hypothetical protein
MRGDSESIFLSYSRKDRALVAKFEYLLRAIGARPWRDESAIAPGTRWQLEIVDAVEGCQRMLFFWCRHSNESVHVRHEYTSALKLNKVVVPIQLDSTSLTYPLSRLQSIDLRSIGFLTHLLTRIVLIAAAGAVVSAAVWWVLGFSPTGA